MIFERLAWLDALRRNGLGTAVAMMLIFMFSCEIEDEYSNPDVSEVLGRRLATSSNLPNKLYWVQETDEILSVGAVDVVAIGIEKQTLRSVTFPPSEYGYYYSWKAENKIYLLAYDGKLSYVDIVTFKFTNTLVDSVMIPEFAQPFSTTHIAYSRIDTLTNQYSVYLYDLTSGKETYVASGQPWLFSPDGKQLLFESGMYFIYDLVSNTITPVSQNISYGAILRWAPEGIISFTTDYYNANTIVATNTTKNQKIGEWRSYFGLPFTAVSPSGNSIIISKTACGYPNVIGECPGYTKIAYSIVDVLHGGETPLIYHVNSSVSTVAFSADEKNFVYAINGQIYVTENEN